MRKINLNIQPKIQAQTRRTISFRRQKYEQVREYCYHNNLSMSHFMEILIDAFFDTSEITPEVISNVVPSSEKDTESIRGGGLHFM